MDFFDGPFSCTWVACIDFGFAVDELRNFDTFLSRFENVRYKEVLEIKNCLVYCMVCVYFSDVLVSRVENILIVNAVKRGPLIFFAVL